MRFTQVFCVVSGLIAAASAIPNADVDASVDVAKRWKQERVEFKGVLAITAANGTFIGYLSKRLSRFGTYVACTHKSKAASISFKASKSHESKTLLLKVENSEYAKTPFLGAVIQRGFSLSTGKDGKRAGSAASSSAAGSGPTDPNQPPASTPNSFDPSGSNQPPHRRDENDAIDVRSSDFEAESAIWTFDPVHNKVTGSFVNPDKKPVTVALHYNPHSPPGVDLVSDVHAYKHANPESFAINVEFISH